MPGIHHVTAIAGDAAANLAFYRNVLGLRLIKTTVNFDDPGTYHLYFGDDAGQPGTVLTFFPHGHAAKGRPGIGQAVETAFAIPAASLGWWAERLARLGIEHGAPVTRLGETTLALQDRDGTSLALTAVAGTEALPGHAQGDVPAQHAIRGIHGVTLWVASPDPSAAVLTGALGFAAAGVAAQEPGGTRHRFTAPGQLIGSVVDLLVVEGLPQGRMGAGSVHHVAFRAGNDGEQAQMAERLRQDHRIAVTEQKERNYFRSVYFREASGVIFEIATDGPGFAVDEPMAHLGEKLMLPPWLEPQRRTVEATLPTLDLQSSAATS